MAINHHIKRILFKCYALIAVLVFAAAMVFAISGKLDWKKIRRNRRRSLWIRFCRSKAKS